MMQDLLNKRMLEMLIMRAVVAQVRAPAEGQWAEGQPDPEHLHAASGLRPFFVRAVTSLSQLRSPHLQYHLPR